MSNGTKGKHWVSVKPPLTPRSVCAYDSWRVSCPRIIQISANNWGFTRRTTHTHTDETGNQKKWDCQLVIRRVGMATNKVAMGMTVLKWMKEGIISTLGPANWKSASYCKATSLFFLSSCVNADFETPLRTFVTEDVTRQLLGVIIALKGRSMSFYGMANIIGLHNTSNSYSSAAARRTRVGACCHLVVKLGWFYF